MPEPQNLGEALAESRRPLDDALERALQLAEGAPAQLLAAARHPIDAGGKRLRPALVSWVAQAEFQSQGQNLGSADLFDRIWAPCAAIELLHTYSLVHDDLPCMDDDDLRRGQPTTHVIHGEAVAVLVGDGLQALAFEVLASGGGPSSGAMVSVLARAGGLVGMVGGQALDLAAEGQQPNESALLEIHEAKTAALLGAACELGALSAGADFSRCAQWRAYGIELGMLFQFVDDLLDVTASSAVLGKTAGKDEAAGKVTVVSLLGVEGAQRRVGQMAEKLQAAAILGQDGAARVLGRLPGWIVGRTS